MKNYTDQLLNFGYKLMGGDWYFNPEKRELLHICDYTPDRTGDFPKTIGMASCILKRCGECRTEVPDSLQMILSLQRGLGGGR